ncbi:MAG: NusG domain II-containing protein [Clostridia bacterium]|nr:NusG domain II-containing protein [Oscillospiraceae bacterium]MBQ3763261.1 NusG domain II-containing protein [Clostridia bacterium]
MKTRTWILLFSALAAVCLLCTFLILNDASTGGTATVRSDGVTVMTLDLSKDGEYRIASDYGMNTLRVENGKVSVISADCPSQDCVHHAPASSGAPIVCLPNRLVITFSTAQEYDAIIG